MAIKGERFGTNAQVFALLAVADYTVADVVRELGIKRSTADYHLRRAHAEKLVHIFDWQRSVGVQGNTAAIYRLGEGVDKPKPRRLSDKVYAKRHYKRNHAKIAARRAAKKGTLNPFTQLIHGALRAD